MMAGRLAHLAAAPLIGHQCGQGLCQGRRVTSPDHGTAYNIAGRNVADESSFRTAVFLALDIIKNRENTEENRKNSLKHEGDVRKLLKK